MPEIYLCMYICYNGIGFIFFYLFFSSGREFFVGLSKRTNQRGAEILADAFKVSVNGQRFPVMDRGIDV